MSFHRRSTGQKLRYARFLREHPTRAEQRLWEALRTTSWGSEVLRQQQLVGWIADLHFARQGLVIEIDGKVHENRQLTDLHRDRVMEGRGLRVLRIPSELVPRIEDQILAQIRTALFLEITPDLPLGPKLWQHFRERARRDLTEIHRLNQRMFLAHQFWEGTTLHLQRLSEAGFRLASEIEFETPEHSEIWMTGWDQIILSEDLRYDTPDLVFYHKGQPISGLLLLPISRLKRFLEEERQAWSDYPYPCLVTPVNELLYRSERPWHYGQPLPVLDLVLGTATEHKKRVLPFESPQSIGVKKQHLAHKEALLEQQRILAQASAQEAQPTEPDELESIFPSPEAHPIDPKEQGIPPKETPILFARDGWPAHVHAFRVADLYLEHGKSQRELYFVLTDPNQEGGALLFCQSRKAVLAKAPPPLEDALNALSEAFRLHLQALQEHKIFADSPMRWRKLSPKQRRSLRKDLTLGLFPPRYVWDESAQQWTQPRYTKHLHWDTEQDDAPAKVAYTAPQETEPPEES